MPEFVDILDQYGNHTGEVMLKSQAHHLGLFHPTVHIWVCNDKQEILLQKRHPDKIAYPNLWDVSVAGHISAGEDPVEAAVREVQEEIGLNLSGKNLQKIGMIRSDVKHHEQFHDREFHHVYRCLFNDSLQTLTLQSEEVTDVRFLPLSAYLEMQKNAQDHSLVPLSQTYLELLAKELNP
ncbi:NUDIX hydrolase [Robertkochia aurantiaca]|uniref:NUDIX hydrolase n=1 Tax=Robertkochia aurantiaca TaxID=2873700 RepID=UPI001CCD0E24|nr:NUDIX domain-containing protein [Robertkochia sp. 3YJGBD-33]